MRYLSQKVILLPTFLEFFYSWFSKPNSFIPLIIFIQHLHMSPMYYCSTWIFHVISTLHDKLLSKILVVCYHESLISLGWLSWTPDFPANIWRSVSFICRLCTLKSDRPWLDRGCSLTVSSGWFFLTVHSPDSKILLEHFRSKWLLIS